MITTIIKKKYTIKKQLRKNIYTKYCIYKNIYTIKKKYTISRNIKKENETRKREREM